MIKFVLNFFCRGRQRAQPPREDMSPTSILVRLMAAKMITREARLVARRPTVRCKDRGVYTGKKVASHKVQLTYSLPVSELELKARCNPFNFHYRPGEDIELTGLYFKREPLVLSIEDKAFLNKTLRDLVVSETARVNALKQYKSEQRAVDAIAQTMGVEAPPMIEEPGWPSARQYARRVM